LLGRRLNDFIGTIAGVQERSAVLYQSARLLGAPPTLKQSLDPLFSGLLHRYGLSACALFTAPSSASGAEKDPGVYTVEFAAGLSTEFAHQLRVRSGEGVAGVALASARVRAAQPQAENEPDPLLKSLWERQH